MNVGENKGICLSAVLVCNYTAEGGLQQGEIKTERAAVSIEVKLSSKLRGRTDNKGLT